MTRSNAKAPALGGVSGAIKSEPNPYEGEQTMSTVPRIPAHFETAIKVAGLTVAPNQLSGGSEPDENVVTIITLEETLLLTPAEACALAAALQAVAVHLMESTELEREAA